MGVSGEKTVDMALTREGYLTKRGRVLLQAGGTTNWDATLEPDPTYVTEAERLRQEQARRATERQQAEQQRQAEAERPQRIRTETVSNQAKRPQRNLKPWLVLAAVGIVRLVCSENNIFFYAIETHLHDAGHNISLG